MTLLHVAKRTELVFIFLSAGNKLSEEHESARTRQEQQTHLNVLAETLVLPQIKHSFWTIIHSHGLLLGLAIFLYATDIRFDLLNHFTQRFCFGQCDMLI